MLGSLDRSISVAPIPLLTSGIGAITDADRKKYEEERSALYQQVEIFTFSLGPKLRQLRNRYNNS